MSHNVVDVPDVGPVIRVGIEVQVTDDHVSIMSRRARWVHVDGRSLTPDEAASVAAFMATHRPHGGG